MNVYGYRILNTNEWSKDGKFPGLPVVAVGYEDRVKELALPGLLIFHAKDQEQVARMCKGRQMQLAILFVGTEPFVKPIETATDLVHCLSYRVYTPCDDLDVEEKFRQLVEVARGYSTWDGVALSKFWGIVEREPVPDALLAWYLVELARSMHVHIDAAALPRELEEIARREFASRPTAAGFDLGGVRAVLSEIYGRK